MIALADIEVLGGGGEGRGRVGEERVCSTHWSVSTTTTNTSTPPAYLCHNRRSQLIHDGNDMDPLTSTIPRLCPKTMFTVPLPSPLSQFMLYPPHSCVPTIETALHSV
jgi:hypothetical protein